MVVGTRGGGEWRRGDVAHKEACPKTFSPMFWCHLKVLVVAEEAERHQCERRRRQQMDGRLVHPSLPILLTRHLSSPQKFPLLSSPPTPAKPPPPPPHQPSPPLSLFYCSFQCDEDEATRLLGQKSSRNEFMGCKGP